MKVQNNILKKVVGNVGHSLTLQTENEECYVP
jgi:hypothetical protein